MFEKVVTGLVEPFKCMNHVVYYDNFFATLAQDQVFDVKIYMDILSEQSICYTTYMPAYSKINTILIMCTVVVAD